MKCAAGCKHFSGGELKHHKDCPFYEDSLSKKYDEMESLLRKVNFSCLSYNIEYLNIKEGK